MTAPRDMLPVEQSDREAAADFWAGLGNVAWQDWQADWMRDGIGDTGPVVQVFARHRLAHSAPAPIDDTVERVARAISREDLARILSKRQGPPDPGQRQVGAWWWHERCDRCSPQSFEGECRAEDLAQADAVIAAMLQPASDDGWQPIESAPRDGTRILGCWMPQGPRDRLAYGVVYWLSGSSGWRESGNDVAPPTHWRPLPAPPSTAAAADRGEGGR